MRTSNTELFELIKTLSKNEKTYFKRSAFDTGESKLYYRLFDEIDKQQVYDERKLKDKFKQVKQFSSVKTQLYEAILKSLGRLADSLNYGYKISAMIKNADQLSVRGLYGQAEKLLLKAKKAAYQTEDFVAILQILNIEKKLILKQYIRDEKMMKSLHDEENNIIKLLKNLSEFNELFTNTYLYFIMYGYLRSKTDEERLLKVTGLENVRERDGKFFSKRARQLYYETLHLYYTSKFDTDKAFRYTEDSLKLMENNPDMIKVNVERYLATFQNYVLQFYYKGNIQQMEAAVERLRKFLNDTNIHIPRLTKVTVQGKLYDIMISAYYGACQFEKTGVVLKDAEKLIEDNFSVINISIKNITWQMGAFYYFTIEDYSNSLRLVNKLLNDPDSLKFLEVYCFILLFRLLIHFEMGNYDLIDYIRKSTKRYLSKTEKLFKIEKIMLAFFGRIINTSGNEQMKIFKELQTELKELKNDNEENTFDYFDFLSWCECKIRNVKYIVILKEKYKEKENKE